MDYDNTKNLRDELSHITEHLEKCEEINLQNYVEYNYEVKGNDQFGVHGKYRAIDKMIRGMHEQIRAIDELIYCVESDFAKLNKKE